MKLTTQHPAWPLLRQSPDGAGRWGNYRFVVNETVEECDFWVVCDGLLASEETRCPAGATMLVTWEPPVGVRPPYDADFVRQFDAVLTCHPNMQHPGVILGQQGHPWFVNRSYDELKAQPFPQKTVPLVIITSDKAFSAGHRARLEFALALKEHLGADARLVGRGIEGFDDKWSVLASARYALVAENAVYDHWMTEKLPDAFLAGSFPLYFGAPNVHDYFPPESLLRIDISDRAGAFRMVDALLGDKDHLERARPFLHQAKEHYLDQLQLFPLLSRLIDAQLHGRATQERRAVRLRPERPSGSLPRRLARRFLR